MDKEKVSCVQPAKGPITSDKTESSVTTNQKLEEQSKMIAKVGKPAPDFEATGFFEGSFKNFRLSEFKGQWIVLCFYPGDFTFV